MELISWLPSVTTTSLLAIAFWLSRKLIETRLTNSVKHEFDIKLEQVRAEFREKEELLKADLRSKDVEIAALRNGAMTAMASRQMVLDKRRVEAVEQLWSAVISLAGAKGVSAVVANVKFDVAAKRAQDDERIRSVFSAFDSWFDPNKIDLGAAENARPFLSQMAWALFSAYRAIVEQSLAKFTILKTGVGPEIMDVPSDKLSKLIQAALPHQEAFINKYGDACYHYLLDEIEGLLLVELQKILKGTEADKETVERAAAIVALANNILKDVNLPLQNTPNGHVP